MRKNYKVEKPINSGTFVPKNYWKMGFWYGKTIGFWNFSGFGICPEGVEIFSTITFPVGD